MTNTQNSTNNNSTRNNAIRFLVTGDLHWTGRNPKARTDDYREALTTKLKEIYQIANNNQCSAIIIPGDLFDSVGASLQVINQLGRLFQQSPVSILTIHGGSNHGVYGGNPRTKPRTPYGVLSTFEAVYDLTERPFHEAAYHTEEQQVGVYVEGHGYDVSITDRDIKYYMKTIPKGDVNIVVTHGMLLERSPGYKLRHTLMRDVAECDKAPDVLINGHYHEGTGVKRIGDTLFVNPGSIGRIKANEENLNRIPKVALLTIPADAGTKNNEPQAELIPLQTALPGHKVLSREHIEEAQRKRKMTEEFLGLLAEEGRTDYMELDEIMRDVAGRESLSDEVVNEALRRVEVEREKLDDERRVG